MDRVGDHFLTIDLSTTACKVLIFNSAGEPVSESYRAVRIFHPDPDSAEVDAKDWWRIAVECIREALQTFALPPSRIAGIGTCGLMHAMVPVCEFGEPLDKVMLWMDRRCKSQCEWIAENVSEFAGRTVRAYYSAPKLRWIVENKPEVVNATHKFMFGKDYIRLKLTGQFQTDASDAKGSALFDEKRGNWSTEILEAIGIPKDKMPEILGSTEVAGYVTKSASEETGLETGTPVVIGASDVQSTLIGVNIYIPGRTCLYMGTAAWMATCKDGKSIDWLGATTTWGASLKWYKEAFNDSITYPEMDELAQRVPPGAEGLIFLPHLMGKRGPKSDPYAKGTFFGLTLMHRREHIIRSIFEGNAYLIRHIIDNYGAGRIGDIVAAGGGAKSRLWRQIVADVTQKAVSVPRVAEASALGSAVLAAVGTGFFATLDEAQKNWVQILDPCMPDRTLTEKYNKIYELYRCLDAALEPFYPAS